ncbi:MAG: succinate dehydrogenase [Caldisphaera sp.]|jgi:succinate dehydrogenase / fumarate reductase cytochrome b subunit|nr:succinate dehydrogenase [Caldisphaera sp.]PMP60534.1 MAG: succinate dehydrogenase [Caldisphaera sp.]PMP89640.1 MAG: succinate dehydrogenase [Caldisphaera sp.]
MSSDKKDSVELENRPGFWRESLNPWLIKAKNNPERVAYVLHRVTGFIIIAFLVLHIVETDSPVWSQYYPINGYSGWTAWAYIMGVESAWYLKIGEFIVAGAVFFHALNGFRLLLTEFFGVGIGKPVEPKPPYEAPTLSAPQRTWLYIVFVLAIVLWAFSAYLIFW